MDIHSDVCREVVIQIDNTKTAPKAAAVLPSTNDTNNALAIIEILISVGKREEAVEMALQHHLYHHAILISMVCAHKDYYLKAVDAIVKEQLSCHSPLAHAYCLFNNRTMPPFVEHGNCSGNGSGDSDIAITNLKIDGNNSHKAGVTQTSQNVKLRRLR